ncbi:MULTISPECIES: GNAT family N-acetyltransferase [Amycolatopsis]|uniref:GNAT family N-acetyltransferase n=1 Tax=Amycolatopsis thermalba TaxID=944492 RepID=A0ABY4NTC9_9PSEU|nr:MULTISPECIES: GNAT family N-acetyltransferase [Amycolatopsis]OXM65584.1 GNAT family N-acetyltransferase [Amycolatopsis sp. KNN50.9b]UQS23316.1 GNAT family N-acetyltransferase [Amycolatopsis thermalba]
MTVTWRALRRDDAEAVAELFAAGETVEPTGEEHSVADIGESLESPNSPLPDAGVAVVEGDRLIAYAMTARRTEADPVHRMRVESMVHPDHRSDALGAELLRWYEEASAKLHAKVFPGAPLELHAAAHENQRWYASVLCRGGYEVVRTIADMAADLSALPPIESTVEPVPYEARYEEATRLALNEAFREHFASTALTPELFRHWVTGSAGFQPDLSFLLLDSDRVIALVLCLERGAADGEVVVEYVGTLPEARGRGAARSLVAAALRAARARGYRRAVLGVDSENPTGAQRVYERCGFVVTGHWHVHARPVSGR